MSKKVELSIQVQVEAYSDRDPSEWAWTIEETLGDQLKEFLGEDCSISVSALGSYIP